MSKLFEKMNLPKQLQGASSAKVEMQFMERGSFEKMFSKSSFITKGLVATAEELSAEDDRARMM